MAISLVNIYIDLIKHNACIFTSMSIDEAVAVVQEILRVQNLYRLAQLGYKAVTLWFEKV